MAARSLNEGSSRIGQIIREYRKARGVTQKQFAGELGVEARTLRMYENGERVLENVSDLRRIADLLAIDPVELGLAARPTLLNAQQIEMALEQIASLIQQARLVEARTISETLLRDLVKQDGQGDQVLRRALASAYCMAGQVQTLTRKTREIAQVLQYYREMAAIASELEDQPLLALALAYHGDLLRRRGDTAQALEYLERAQQACPLESASVRGIIALLAARVHLVNEDIEGFVEAMACARELAEMPDTDILLTQFGPGAVYAEYARGYGLQGKLEQSLRYVQLAETHFSSSNLWGVVLKAIRAEALVHAGDVLSAMPLLIEVAHLAQMYGHQLLIERLYRLQYYLEDQVSLLRKASRSLSDVLYGPIEQ